MSSKVKALLFLSAGAVIHSWSDEQDQRRYGGLINLIPLTYTCILIGSMSLIAAPYLTGNYSKEMILEAAYGQYKSEGIIGFWLGAITAGITSFYSFKLLYWTFISRPNGQRSNNIGVNDPSNTIIIPLCILSVLSIVHGYWAKDGLIGVGSTIWAGSIWIKPENQTMIEGEFGGIGIKMIPMIISIIMIIIGVRIYMGSRVGGVVVSKRIKRLLIGKYHMENIYNSIIVSGVLGVSSKTGKNLDKGIMEIIGASGVKRVVGVEGEALGCLDSGYIPHLAINIIIGLIMALSLGEGIIGVEDIMMIIILKISINKEGNLS